MTTAIATNGNKKALEKVLQPTPGILLDPTDMMMSGYLALGTQLGGGMLHIPDNPTIVWPLLFWNMPFAQYVFDDMEEKDDKVGGDLDARKENVLSKPRFVKPASEKLRDRKIAEFVEETLEEYAGAGSALYRADASGRAWPTGWANALVGGRLPFDNFLWEAMDAVGNGVAIGEIEWSIANDGRVFPANVHFKPQSLFSFSSLPFGDSAGYAFPQVGPLRLRPGLGFALPGYDEALSLEEQYPGKFFVHTFRPKRGNRWGSPIKRRCFWWTWFKRNGIRAWLRMLEKGPGTVIARYDQSEADAARALEAAQAIQEEAQASIPKRFDIELLEHVRGQMGSMHKDLVDDICNNAIARIILGQTLTSRGSEGGGSRALGEVHERVAQKKTEVDAKSLMIAVNTQLVWPIVLYNFGPVEKPPVWTIKYEPGADTKLRSDVLDRAHNWGLKIATADVYEDLEIRAPEEGEEVLPPPVQPPKPKPADNLGESAAFAESEEVLRILRESVNADPLKKKLSSRRLKQQILSRERLRSLRPSGID